MDESHVWNFARGKVFTCVEGELERAMSGLGSADGYEALMVWGTNRFGNDFYTQVIETVKRKQVCEWDPYAGVKIHHFPALERTSTITYGFNDDNEPIEEGDCPTKYLLEWETPNSSGFIYKPL